jgi:hypothetical protein
MLIVAELEYRSLSEPQDDVSGEQNHQFEPDPKTMRFGASCSRSNSGFFGLITAVACLTPPWSQNPNKPW